MRHGGGEYSQSVVSRIAETGRLDSIAFLGDRRLPGNDYTAFVTDVLGMTLHEADDLRGDARASSSTYYSPLPYRTGDSRIGQRTVMTIHGLRSIELPTDSLEHRYRRFQDWPRVVAKRVLASRYRGRRVGDFRRLIDVCDEIVVPSEHSQHALYLHVPESLEKPVHVMFSPATPVMSTRPAAAFDCSEYGLTKQRYLLVVSAGRFEKNALRVMRAMHRVEQAYPSLTRTFKLALAGGKPRYVRARELPDSATFLPYLDVGALAGLYRDAGCLVYPTLNEGFGYPPVEALTHGTPSIVSAVCSLPELLGDACTFVNARDELELANRLLTFMLAPVETLSPEMAARLAAIRARQEQDLERLLELLWA